MKKKNALFEISLLLLCMFYYFFAFLMFLHSDKQVSLKWNTVDKYRDNYTAFKKDTVSGYTKYYLEIRVGHVPRLETGTYMLLLKHVAGDACI